jgi:hypothetical protein
MPRKGGAVQSYSGLYVGAIAGFAVSQAATALLQRTQSPHPPKKNTKIT